MSVRHPPLLVTHFPPAGPGEKPHFSQLDLAGRTAGLFCADAQQEAVLHRGGVTPAVWKQLQQADFPKPGQIKPSFFFQLFSLPGRNQTHCFDPIKSLLKTTAGATSQLTRLRLSSSAKVSYWDAAKQKVLCLVDTERQQEIEDAHPHSTQLPEGWKRREGKVKLTQAPHSICTREEKAFSGLDAISTSRCRLTPTAPCLPHCSKPTRVTHRALGSG